MERAKTLQPLNYKLLIVASLAINIMSLALPLMTLQVYDRILTSKSLYTLSILSAGVVIVCLVEVIIRYCRMSIVNYYGAKCEDSLYNLYIKNILSFDKDRQGQDYGASYYLYKTSSLSKIGEFISGDVIINLVDVPFALLFVFLIFYIGEWLVLIPISVLLLYMILLKSVNSKLKQSMDYRDKVDTERLNFVIETLKGIHSAKSMSLEKLFERKYERMQLDTSVANYNLYNNNLYVLNYSNLFSELMVVGIVAFGMPLVLKGQLTLGSIIACVLLAARIIRPVQRIAYVWNKYQSFYSSLEILEEDINRVTCDKMLRGKNVGRLEIENASFGFVRKEPIFEDINLDLKIGDAISISGGKGSGKTLLLKLIFGIYTPTKGRILVNGEDVSDISSVSLAEQIAFLSASGVVFRGTIWDNITLFGKYSDNEVLEVSELIGLDKEVKKLPEGYNTKLEGSNSDIISPGIKQRISIVRSLVSRPKIILFDNTDRSLDREGYNTLYSLFSKIKEKVVLVLVSDDMNLRKLATKHYVLQDKKLIQVAENSNVSKAATKSNLYYQELPI